MSISSAIRSIPVDVSARLLENYFAEGEYTGAHFGTLGADQDDPMQITAADLLAVQTLSVKVPARASIAILGEFRDATSGYLREIDPTIEIACLDQQEFTSTLGEHSPAMQLWDLLRRNGAGNERWGIGPTIASKILARKRPNLIPIQDSVVDSVIELGRGDAWKLWWEALSESDDLATRAATIRERAGHPELSTLRTFDIVLWMHRKHPIAG